MRGADGEAGTSVRDMEIVDAESISLPTRNRSRRPRRTRRNTSRRMPWTAIPARIGPPTSRTARGWRWTSARQEDQPRVDRMGNGLRKSFSVEVSSDGKNWTEVYKTGDGKGGISEIKFAPVAARQVRLVCTSAARSGAMVCAKSKSSKSETSQEKKPNKKTLVHVQANNRAPCLYLAALRVDVDRGREWPALFCPGYYRRRAAARNLPDHRRGPAERQRPDLSSPFGNGRWSEAVPLRHPFLSFQ